MAKTSKIIDTSQLQRFWDGFKTKLHIHPNQTILDSTTASFTTEEKAKLSQLDPDKSGIVYGEAEPTNKTSDMVWIDD